MPIIIRNIQTAEDDRELSRYSLSINNEEICQFNHARVHGLAECLRQASSAAEIAHMENVERILSAVDARKPE